MRAARDEEMIWELLLENQPRILNLIVNVLIQVNLNVICPKFIKILTFTSYSGSKSLY